LVGGHCIGVDPYYLTHKAQILGYIPQVILAGRSINDGMGNYIAGELVKQMILNGSSVKGAYVTVLGLTFKEIVPDLRNTRVIDIVHELQGYGINVQVHDPIADACEAEEEYGLHLVPSDKLAPADAVVLAVSHEAYLNAGWEGIGRHLRGGKGVVVDVKAKLPRHNVPAGITLWRL
jgi:UDP-N-acetyl-D-galactosamine dehydrogenase